MDIRNPLIRQSLRIFYHVCRGCETECIKLFLRFFRGSTQNCSLYIIHIYFVLFNTYYIIILENVRI